MHSPHVTHQSTARNAGVSDRLGLALGKHSSPLGLTLGTQVQRFTLVCIARRWWRRRPLTIGVPGTRRIVHWVPRHGKRWETGALVWIAISSRCWSGGRCPSDGTTIAVKRRRRGREGASLVWVETGRGHALSHHGWRGRRGWWNAAHTAILIWGHAIRTSSIFLIIIHYPVTITANTIATPRKGGASRWRGWRRGRGITRRTKSASAKTRRAWLGVITRETGCPIAPSIRRTVTILISSRPAFRELDMNPFAWEKEIQPLQKHLIKTSHMCTQALYTSCWITYLGSQNCPNP